MNSEDNQFQSEVPQPPTEPTPQLKRSIHPDSLKFMGMAKELLDSPAVQQAIENEKDKEQKDN